MKTVITSNYFDSFTKKIFKDCGIKIIIIRNDDNPPALIFNHKKILNCRLVGDYLIFTNHYVEKGLVFKIHIKPNYVLTDENIAKIKDWFIKSKHQYCYRIKTKNLPLYLCDYQELIDYETQKVIRKYPSFAQHNSKYYFSKRDARKILKLNNTETVELEIV